MEKSLAGYGIAGGINFDGLQDEDMELQSVNIGHCRCIFVGFRVLKAEAGPIRILATDLSKA